MPNTLNVKNEVNAGEKREAATPKLLLIDDDESVRKVMKFRLKDSYNIIDSGSPEEALSLALQHKPDAILLDLMMPKYSGFEVCQTLSSLSFTSHIPILIVSGESSERYKEYCESLGAKGFFQKPVNVEALQKALTDLIKRSHDAPQPEPRVRLRIMLRLRGIDSNGKLFELLTPTDNVGAAGFLCGCSAQLEVGTTVQVTLAAGGLSGPAKALVTRVDWPGTDGQRCDFQFLEKPADWILK
jgi:CheY-like chemotaxis protein